ncbi:MAG: outer membrane beta-barrel family protein [Rikenellaceae bacterium]|jgi:hypothetical protein|nr:outer membrane beta-barrel family protein [Rikenellaceae bacterium]
MFDRSTKFSNSPSLDIYYQEYMKNNQTLALNVVGTYGDTESSRAYGESRAGTLLTDVRNRALGSRYSVIGEGIYEKRRGDNRLTFGARHTYASTDNRYDDGQNNSSNTLMRQNDTYAYGEWASKVKKLSYMVGAGVTHSHVAQQGAGEYDRVTFNPRLSLLYPLSGSSSLRLRSGIYNNNPSPANMSAVDQMIDSLRMQRGNPNLLSFITGSSTLSYEYQKDIYWVSLSGSYEVRPRAVMEEQREENGRFVTTWANQRSWQKANALLGLRVGPIKKILVIQANAGVNHFISDGNSYRHVYTSPFLSTSLFGMYKNFTLFVDWQVEGDGFDGETMDGGQKNMHSAGLAYKWKNLNAMIVMTMPFVNNLYVESENRSALASYKRRLHTNDVTRMLMFQLGYNLSWGRQYQAGQKRLNNKYEEEGVMETKK